MDQKRRSVHRMALVAAVLTYALLAMGGLVTSRDAGMIFPDWPLSNSSLNPPGWLSDADKFSEHGHRILGALVGMATVALAVLIQMRDKRRWMRVLGWTAVGSVIAQGVLGGIRVTEINTFLALFHGCTGQMFFGLMVALAYLSSRDANEKPEQCPPEGRDTRVLFAASCGAAIATLMQIVVGARLRHIYGPLNDHLLGAVVVTGSVLMLVSLVVLRHRGRRALMAPALGIFALLIVQVLLGFFTAALIAPGSRTYNPTFWQVATPSIHQAIGALLFAAEIRLALRAYHRIIPEPVPAPQSASTGAPKRHLREVVA